MAKTDCVSFSFSNEVLDIISVVLVAVGRVVAELDDPKERGGYFCLAERIGNPTALPTLTLGIGTVPAEKGPKYLALAQEKARRLAEHAYEHTSSWQSRSPEESRWGGAIVAGHYLFSFSGLPEIADETAMLITAMELEYLTLTQAMAIAGHSDNKLFIRMLTVPKR